MRYSIYFKGLCLSLAMFFVVSGSAWALESTLDDQTHVAVTVYNSNLGLVKDTRTIALAPGQGELRFMDVAASIMPVSVLVKSLNAPNAFSVLEQNYEYDLMNHKKLLDKYVGKTIKIMDWNKFQDRVTEVEAKLLSNNSGPIYEIDGQIYMNHPGVQILPEIPENLISKPTLVWLYDNDLQRSHELEVSYLTSNLNWKADYVMVLDAKDKAADLSGWVTVDNQSGTTYRNAKLKLVAGDIHRAPQRQHNQYDMVAMESAVRMKAAAPAFQEESFFEYHLYDLQRSTTLKNNQTKQINLLEATGAQVKKEYLVYGMHGYWTSLYRPSNPKLPVNVDVVFKNAKENQLGMPLPAGVIRLYKQDSKGSQQLIGEDRINHTPKDEEVRLRVGDAFDVVAERIQTDFKVRSSTRYLSSWKVSLRNRKDSDITVRVIEPLHGDWKILSSTHAHKKRDARTVEFEVPVKAGQEVDLEYRVQFDR